MAIMGLTRIVPGGRKFANRFLQLNAITGFLLFICFAQFFLLHHSSSSKKLPISAVSHFDGSSSSTTFQKLLTSAKFQKFSQSPLQQKCEAYYDELYEADENWSIQQMRETYSVDVSNVEEYYANKYKEIAEQYNKENKQIDKDMVMKIFQSLKTKKENNQKIENNLKNSVGHLRIYGTCYINNNHKFEQNSRCLDIESRLFPWMTFESPIFERWDGTIVKDFPEMSKYYEYEGMGYKEEAHIFSESCFLSHLKGQFNGKGIVFSIGDQLVGDMINLLKIFRKKGNTLPIQFVHKGDLSVDSKRKLREACRFPLRFGDQVIDTNAQECWFVDAKRCILEEYYGNFNSWANKWIAVLFNSFHEMILMDTDIIPFIKPEDFFKLGNYEQNGAYFFKDRVVLERFIPAPVIDLYLQMFPTPAETSLFDIPQVTDLTLNNRLFTHRLRHSIEAGVVMMDRRKKLLGLLTAVHIQFWAPLTEYIHGEKEIFWLSQSVAGDENYEFSPNSAGAVGRVEPVTDKRAERVVGIQPAHIAPDNQTLLWINSGAKICKMNTWEQDFKVGPFKDTHGSPEGLRDYFNSAITIEGGVIPPESFKEWPNDDGGPKTGWEHLADGGCGGYFYAANSRVGSLKETDAESFGKVINFNQIQKDQYNEIVKNWIAPVIQN